MVVDDTFDVRKTAKDVLEKEGYEVITAVDGDDCLKKLKHITPDLILMDIMMPGPHVSKIVEQIPKIKVAYLSVVRKGDASTEGLLKFDNIVNFIEKPYSVDKLVKEVKKSLRKKL